MFGLLSKLFVLVIAYIILSSQFDSCSSKPSGYGKNGNAGNKPCLNKLCVGKCGKPGCTQPLSNGNGKTQQKPCQNAKCVGECRSPGCLINRAENRKPEDPDDLTPAKTLSNDQSPPLRGDLSCQKVLLSKELTGPIFTSNSTDPKPYAQCTKCSLQTTPDNTAVIISCYDCTDLKPVPGVCGGVPDDEPNSTKEAEADTKKDCRSSSRSGIPDYKSSGPNQVNPVRNQNKINTEIQNQENGISECGTEIEVEPEDQEYCKPSFVYLVYYIEIANYTERQPSCTR